METAPPGAEPDDDAPGPVLRAITLVARAGAVGLGIVASVEVLQPSGMGPVAGALAACALLVGLPLIGLVAALRDWPRPAAAAASLAVWIAAGAAVLVASSLRPLSHVRGMQTGGLLVVAIAMFVVPVLKGGYVPRGATLLTDRWGSQDPGGPRPWS